MPGLPSAALPDRLIVGDLPGEPLSFQERPALSKLAGVFQAGRRVAVVCAVTGARGVGKTQIAAAYARQQAVAGCPLVAWVSGESTDVLLAGLAEVARAVGVADPDGDSLVSARQLRAHLETRDELALLVVDNAVDADAVRPLLPVVGPTQVTITSTDHAAFMQLGTTVDVSVFDRPQSLAYLRVRTGCEDEQDADRVAEELGDLPLAVAQAASVIVLQQLSFVDYLTRLRTLPIAKMLPRSPGDPYPKGAAEAILLSVQAAIDADTSGLADRALSVIAVLAPGGVDRTVLHQIIIPTSSNEYELGSVEAAARVDDVLGRLVGLSLLVWGESGRSVIVHRLVARVIRERALAAGVLASTIVDAAQLLTGLRIPEHQAWSARDKGSEVVGHALILWEAALRLFSDHGVLVTKELAVCANLVNWAVEHLVAVADLSRAVHIAGQVLADCGRTLGDGHPETLQSRNNLARAYVSAGRLSEAISLYEQTLAEREREPDSDRVTTLCWQNDLANAYVLAGQPAEAIALSEKTLAERERVLGPDHPDTLASRNTLAEAYRRAGRRAEAISLHEQTLAERERVLGPNHPDTLTSRNNLACSMNRGRAYRLYKQTLAERERVLGPNHPHTLQSRKEMADADLWKSKGRPHGVFKLWRQYQEILTERERTLGPDHPDTIAARTELASEYAGWFGARRALPLWEKNLAARERLLGHHHPDTLASRALVASGYQVVGRVAEALPLCEQTLAERKRVLGPDHRATLASGHQLAEVYQAADRLAEAILLYEQTLAEQERVLGLDHRDTLASLHALAAAYRLADRRAEAISLYEQKLADTTRLLGTRHPATREVRENLQRARRQLQKWW